MTSSASMTREVKTNGKLWTVFLVVLGAGGAGTLGGSGAAAYMNDRLLAVENRIVDHVQEPGHSGSMATLVSVQRDVLELKQDVKSLQRDVAEIKQDVKTLVAVSATNPTPGKVK